VVAIYLQKTVHEGLWARRMALFFVQLLILTVLLHRFGTLATPAAMNLVAVSIGGLLLAIIVAVVGLVRIWFGGQIGAAQAFTGIAIALVGLAVPLFFLSQYFLLPRLNDIQTTRQPMEFKQLAAMRPADANRIVEPDLAAAEEREKAYPDIRPMELERSVTETFDIVHEAVKRLGWTIVLSEPPDGDQPGHIEATNRTMIMGYTNDALIRVTGDDAHAFIDVRSVSRYGMHDLGANAGHIRELFAEVKSALEKGEKTGLEQAEPAPKATAPQLKKPVKKRRAKRNRRSQDQPQSQPPAERRGPFGRFPLLSPD
jgi:uncharacterized protein (DUF1499 family)/uncharacterized protein (DUF697 family)